MSASLSESALATLRSKAWISLTQAVNAIVSGDLDSKPPAPAPRTSDPKRLEQLVKFTKERIEAITFLFESAQAGRVTLEGRDRSGNFRTIPTAEFALPITLGFYANTISYDYDAIRDSDMTPDLERDFFTQPSLWQDVLVDVPQFVQLLTAAPTSGAVATCRRQLIAIMTKDRDTPLPKSRLRVQLLKEIDGLSSRGFDRAWAAAIEEAQAPRWQRAGKRKTRITA
jgi:hypothetical protein